MNPPYQYDAVLTSQTYKPARKKRIRWRSHIPAFLFLAPALILFGVFAWFPILKAVAMSFNNVTLAGQYTWEGLDNYALMLKDPAFLAAWGNSVQFAAWSMLGFLLPVTMAVLIREMRHARGFFRVVYFLPTVVPSAIAIIIWRFIYDPDAGFLNELLTVMGRTPQNWLNDPNLVKPSLVLMMTWGAFGTTALIYLATLNEIPTELYEAAELDGAGPLQRIRFITVPYLVPVMSAMLILQVISVMQVFTEPFLMTRGGPGRETLTPALHIYNKSFVQTDLGYAAAWSVTMVIVLLVFSLIYRAVNNRLENA